MEYISSDFSYKKNKKNLNEENIFHIVRSFKWVNYFIIRTKNIFCIFFDRFDSKDD